MKYLFILLGSFVLAGCSLSMQTPPAPLVELSRIDNDCVQQLRDRESFQDGNLSKYLAIASHAKACLGEQHFAADHPDNQLAMQLQALAVNNYIKAGDIASARDAFTTFKTKFPMQDLVYPDFTSFVDSVTAILDRHKLTQYQIARLNINPTLKKEISRQQRWLKQ